MTSTFYSSADAGAPQLGANVSGSLNNVLRAVLVNGYGEKSPLGWEIAFEDALTDRIVFRATEGTRCFLLFDDGAVNNSGTYPWATCYAFETMTSIDQWYQRCPPTDTNIYVIKGHSNVATAVPWIIIGDGKFFWLFTCPYHTNSPGTGHGLSYSCTCFGDYVSLDPSNNHNFLHIANIANPNSYVYNNLASLISFIRDPFTHEKGSVKNGQFDIDVTCGAHIGSKYVYPPISPLNGKYMYEAPKIWAPESRPPQYGNSLVGWLPGLLDCYWSSEKRLTTPGQSGVLNDSELALVWDTSGDYSIVQIPVKLTDKAVIVQCMRFSIIVGEGFRRAY
jgi:hypothetical protein